MKLTIPTVSPHAKPITSGDELHAFTAEKYGTSQVRFSVLTEHRLYGDKMFGWYDKMSGKGELYDDSFANLTEQRLPGDGTELTEAADGRVILRRGMTIWEKGKKVDEIEDVTDLKNRGFDVSTRAGYSARVKPDGSNQKGWQFKAEGSDKFLFEAIVPAAVDKATKDMVKKNLAAAAHAAHEGSESSEEEKEEHRKGEAAKDEKAQRGELEEGFAEQQLPEGTAPSNKAPLPTPDDQAAQKKREKQNGLVKPQASPATDRPDPSGGAQGSAAAGATPVMMSEATIMELDEGHAMRTLYESLGE